MSRLDVNFNGTETSLRMYRRRADGKHRGANSGLKTGVLYRRDESKWVDCSNMQNEIPADITLCAGGFLPLTLNW